MNLQSLSLINFKNYPEVAIKLSTHVNCFTGNNGEGKTNILDAIHYLSFCKSFFNPIDSQNIKHEMPFFMIKGIFENRGVLDEIYCSIKRNQKKIVKRNQKEYARLAEHIGLFPLVMISPADSELITEGSENRRRFVDSVIAQYNREYLEQLIQYNRILSHRNALLKQVSKGTKIDADAFEIWDLQLIDLAQRIFNVRSNFINEFIPIFQNYYQYISEAKEKVGIKYISHLSIGNFPDTLKAAFNKDIAMEYSTVGVHKDDLEFSLNDHPLKKYASQGQQKSFLIALKLAQFDFIKSVKKVTPILLLDDIYDKLDDSRVKQLMQLVSTDNFGQLFITDTHPTRLFKIFKTIDASIKVFAINSDTVEVVENEIILTN